MVLPAPFWPTIASDASWHGEVEPGKDGAIAAGVAERHVTEGDLLTRLADGWFVPDSEGPERRHRLSEPSDRRDRAAAPSSAQLRPPKAMRLTPSATWAYTTSRSSGTFPEAPPKPRAPNTAAFAMITMIMHQITGFSRSRVARYCSSNSRLRRAMKRSTVQPARPKSRSSFAGCGSTASR